MQKVPRAICKGTECIILNFLDSDDCDLNVAANEEQSFLEVLSKAALYSGAGDHVAKARQDTTLKNHGEAV